MCIVVPCQGCHRCREAVALPLQGLVHAGVVLVPGHEHGVRVGGAALSTAVPFVSNIANLPQFEL